MKETGIEERFVWLVLESEVEGFRTLDVWGLTVEDTVQLNWASLVHCARLIARTYWAALRHKLLFYFYFS